MAEEGGGLVLQVKWGKEGVIRGEQWSVLCVGLTGQRPG